VISGIKSINKIKLLRINELFYTLFLFFATIGGLISALILQNDVAIFSVVESIIVLSLPFLLYLRISNITNKSLNKDYYFGIVFIGLLVAVQVFFNSIFGNLMGWNVQLERASTTVGGATTTALVLYSIMTISLYQALKTNKLFFKISTLFLILAVLFTETRSAILLMVVLSMSYALNLRKKHLWKYMALFVITLALIYFVNPEPFETIYARFFTNKSSASNEARLFLAKSALLEFMKNPIIGTGLGLGIIRLVDVNSLSTQLSNPHNQHIALLLETGIIGYTLFILFITTTIGRTISSIGRKKIVLRSLIVLVVFGFMFEVLLSVDIRASMSFWILITSLSIQERERFDEIRKMKEENYL
jgi:O-antigen ligase